MMNTWKKRATAAVLAVLIPAGGTVMASADPAADAAAMKQITAGARQLGQFAPKFAELNDKVLFGEVWSRTDKMPLHDRSMITVTALVASGITDSSLRHHIATAKANGVTREEMTELLTQTAFYAGWPKAWAAFRIALEVYGEGEAASEKT